MAKNREKSGMTPNLEISTVVGCKMACDYCPQKIHVNNYKGGRVMTIEDYATCMAKVPSYVDIHFAGMAEPWLNTEATNMVLMAHEQGHRISVYTTLANVTVNDIDLIKHIDFIHFCLHLPDRDGVMKFNVTQNYLDVLLYAMMMIPKRNFVCIGKIHPLVELITGFVPDSSNTLISRAGNIKTLSISPKKGALKCSAMSAKLDHNILLPNGEVLLCCMDYGQQHVLGNLLEIGYEDLFNSNEYHRIKSGLLDENIGILCRTCEIAENADN